MRTIFSSLAGAALVFGLSFMAHAMDPGVGEWTTFGNGPSHSGYYPSTLGSGTFTSGWSQTFSKAINPVAVSGSTVYLTTYEDEVPGMRAFALSAADGSQLWNYPLATANAISAPTFWNGRIYFHRGCYMDSSVDSQVWCLDASTGSLLWVTPVPYSDGSSLAPMVVPEGAFVGEGWGGHLDGFNALSGTQTVSVTRPAGDTWTPSCDGGVVYSLVYGSFLATSATTGAQLWSLGMPMNGWYYGSVPAINGSSAACIWDYNLSVIDLASHSVAWTKNYDYIGTPAIANGVVYALWGSGAQAYQVSDGSLLGQYQIPGYDSGSLVGQPIVTNDRLIFATTSKTYLFDLASYQWLQTLPIGGALSYAAGTLYISSGTTLATYNIVPSQADPAVSSATSPPPAPAGPHPNPSTPLGITPGGWLDCKRFNGIAYFLFANPAKIERYDLNASSWLAPISLPNGPTALAVSDAGIYISFGTTVSRFTLDGNVETPLGNTPDVQTQLFEIGGNLYLFDATGKRVCVVSGSTGTAIDNTRCGQATGLSASPRKKMLFARTANLSPSNIFAITLANDGTISGGLSCPGFGAYNDATRTFPFPSGSRVADDSGNIYSSNDLTYLSSLGGSFDDLDFAGDQPVALRGSTLTVYSNGLVASGSIILGVTPSRLFVSGSNAIGFSPADGRGVSENVTSLGTLVASSSNSLVDAAGLRYTPDAVELVAGDIVYLLHRPTQSIFRWSVSLQMYLTSIPLADVPSHMAYSPSLNRLYLSYPDGTLTKIDLDSGFAEAPFAQTPKTPWNLAVAGDWVFVKDSSYTWYLFSNSGTLLSSKGNSNDDDYTWNAANQRIYSCRADYSHYGQVTAVAVDPSGILGQAMTSPFSSNFDTPAPIRVSPDGSLVVVGSGELLNGTTLARSGSLGINVADAVWNQSGFFTFGGTTVSGTSSSLHYPLIYSDGEIRLWNAMNRTTRSIPTYGRPLRLFTVSDGLVAVSQRNGAPQFAKVGFDLSPLALAPDIIVPVQNFYSADKSLKPVPINLLADFPNPNAKVIGISSPSMGDVFVQNDGSFIYVPRTVLGKFSGTDSFYYQVNDGQGNVFTCKATVSNRFYPRQGTYSGSFSGGALTATVTPGGAISGKLQLFGTTVRFSGTFDASGSFTKALSSNPTGSGPMELKLDDSNGQYTLTGQVNGVAVTLLQTASATLASSHAGKYTLLLQPDSNQTNPSVPQGVGYGLMSISAKGAVIFVGKLADGTPFSASTPIVTGSTADSASLNATLRYPAAGSFSGALVFEDQIDSDCNGLFTWSKPAQSKGLFSAGFNLTCPVIGSRYAAPGFHLPPLVFGDTNPNAHFQCAEGNLAAPLDEDLTISRSNKVTYSDPNSMKLSLAISPGSGLFQGSFVHPATDKRVTFQGVAFLKHHSAAGFFLGQTESGWVSLSGE